MGKKGWMKWDEYDVGKWMKECGLEKFGKVFVENEIKGENLPECLEEKMLAGAVCLSKTCSNLPSYRTCRQGILEAEDHGRNLATRKLIIRSRTVTTNIRPESGVDCGSRRIRIKGAASWQRNTLLRVRVVPKC